MSNGRQPRLARRVWQRRRIAKSCQISITFRRRNSRNTKTKCNEIHCWFFVNAFRPLHLHFYHLVLGNSNLWDWTSPGGSLCALYSSDQRHQNATVMSGGAMTTSLCIRFLKGGRLGVYKFATSEGRDQTHTHLPVSKNLSS